MNNWLQSQSRFERHDPPVDDETIDGRAANHKLVVDMLDSLNQMIPFSHQSTTASAGTLTGEEILAVSAVFYRDEMRSQIPPYCRAVDCTIQNDQLRDELDCNDTMHRHHRATFTLAHMTDGVTELIKEFDNKLKAAVAYAKRPHSDFPRDAFSSSKAMYGRKLPKWRCPHRGGTNDLYKDGAFGEQGGCLNVRPQSDPNDLYASTMEAKHRLVATICWHRRHHRAMLGQILFEMRERATRAAALFTVAERLKDAADVVRIERSLVTGPGRDPLTSIVSFGASEELGDALLPYLSAQMGSQLAMCNKPLYEWTKRFSRHLRLRLTDCGTNYGDWKNQAHRIEADGSLTMQKGMHIKVNPLIYRQFMTHFQLPPDHDPSFVLKDMDYAYPTHEAAFSEKFSQTTVSLVFDDDARTPVPCFGRPAIQRHDKSGVGHHRWSESTISHFFPRKSLPIIVVSAKRLSSEFKNKDQRFRLLIQVRMKLGKSPGFSTLAAETPPFRVVSRIESQEAARGTKDRNSIRAQAHNAHVAKVKATQPETSTDAAVANQMYVHDTPADNFDGFDSEQESLDGDALAELADSL